ncbi:hypothetical protein ACFL1X_14210 [Candidatus Hydrogenedentota bacterium]
MRFVFRIIMLALILLSMASGISFAQTTVETDDGLYLRYRHVSGGILSLTHYGKGAPLTIIEQDYPAFSVTDIVNEDKSARFGFGSNVSEEDSIFLKARGNESELDFSVNISEDYACIRYQIDVKNLASDERALTLRYQLPIKAEGWLWWDDIGTSRVIKPGKRYIHHDREHPGRYPVCWYPLGTISNPDGDHALTLAVALSDPVPCRIGYDGDFFIEMDVGLSPETVKFPNKVRLSFILISSDPKWGMRGGLKKYYDIHPADFVKRVNREGSWLARTPTLEVENPEDFLITFHEHSSVKINVLPFDNDAGIYAFLYDNPSHIRTKWEPDGNPTKESVLNRVETAAADPSHPEHDRTFSIVSRAARQSDGNYYAYFSGAGGWRGASVSIGVNIDPDIPLHKNTELSQLDKWWAESEGKIFGVKEGRHDGVYIDETEHNSQHIDYDREHFKYTDHPLGWDKVTGRPGIIQGVSSFEYYKKLADRLHERGKLFMGNGLPYRYGFYLPLFDVPGTELMQHPTDWSYLYAKQLDSAEGRKLLAREGLTEEDIKAMEKYVKAIGRKEPIITERTWYRPDMMYYRRTLIYQKPFNLLLKLMDRKQAVVFAEEFLDEYLDWAVFFGTYPAPSEGIQSYPERFAPIFGKAIRLVHSLNKAGWEPVTHAWTNDTDVRVERFGYAVQGTLQFTVRNFGSETKDFTLVVDTNALRVPESVDIYDARTGELRDFEDDGGLITTRMTLAPSRTSVLRVVKK